MRSKRSLQHIMQQYVAPYHTERNHQECSYHLLAPEPGVSRPTGQAVRRECLSRLLSYYHRAAACFGT
jgi:hypothetical protein